MPKKKVCTRESLMLESVSKMWLHSLLHRNCRISLPNIWLGVESRNYCVRLTLCAALASMPQSSGLNVKNENWRARYFRMQILTRIGRSARTRVGPTPAAMRPAPIRVNNNFKYINAEDECVRYRSFSRVTWLDHVLSARREYNIRLMEKKKSENPVCASEPNNALCLNQMSRFVCLSVSYSRQASSRADRAGGQAGSRAGEGVPCLSSFCIQTGCPMFHPEVACWEFPQIEHARVNIHVPIVSFVGSVPYTHVSCIQAGGRHVRASLTGPTNIYEPSKYLNNEWGHDSPRCIERTAHTSTIQQLANWDYPIRPLHRKWGFSSVIGYLSTYLLYNCMSTVI